MNQDRIQTDAHGMRDFFLLTVLISLFFGFLLGNRPLSAPDEGRYVEISREMAATGDYLTPRLNGVKYFEKPVLFYWLESFSIKLFGLNEFTLRLWPAFFALFGCLAVYGAGKRLYGRRSGLIAAAVLATSILYYALSRVIILDMPVSVLLAASLLSFLVGTHEAPGWKRRLYMWGFYVFSALAVLTKGLIGILIPGMVIGAWIVLLGEWRVLRTMHLPTGLVLFLLIAVPWHILVGRANPEFFNFYFIHEHFQRYLTKIHGHYKPAWFFIPVLLLGLFPWTAFLVQAVKFSTPSSWRERHEHRDALFLMLWAGLVFFFFSASDSKLMPYILPVFPPLAILIGRYLSAAWEGGELPGIRTGTISLAVLAIVIAAGLVIAPHYRTEINERGLHPYFYLLAFVLGVGILSAYVLGRRKNFKWAFSALVLSTALFLLLADSTGPLLDTRSIKNIALELKPRLKPGDEVVTYSTYYQDLPVYLERRITVVNWKGELAFGTTVEDTSGWMIDGATFWKRWDGPSTVYMLTKRKTYDELRIAGQKNLYLIAGIVRDVLVVNKEMTP
jgi:4-amino-4-deoxy-L-arabinose transferase-like glycosyltransferase